MKADYMQVVASEFFKSLDKAHFDLQHFSQQLHEKNEKVFQYLDDFDTDSETLIREIEGKAGSNLVEKAMQASVLAIKKSIKGWHNNIES